MLNIGQSAGKLDSFAYLLGVYLGDGCAHYRKQSRTYLFILNTIDEDFALRVKEAIKVLLDKDARHYVTSPRGNRKAVHRIEVCSKQLYKVLVDDTLEKTVIPQYVWDWPRERRKLLLIGAFDSDGWFSKSKTRTGKYVYQLGIAKGAPWMKHITSLLNSVGIDCGKANLMKRNDSKNIPILRVLVNKHSWIANDMRFTAQRKHQRQLDYTSNLRD